MPAAAFIVPAVATVAGAAIASHQQGKAAKGQEKTAADALAFTREQEAERRREWEYQQAQAASAWKARQQMIAPFMAGGYSVLGKYGIPVQMQQAPTMPSLSAGTPPPGAAPGRAMPPAAMPQAPASMASMMGQQAPTEDPAAAMGSSPFNWYKWGQPNG